MLLSVGSLYTSATTGYVYEIVALTPKVLYSPIKTYTTRISDSRIFQRTPDDFMGRFFEGLVPLGALTFSSNEPLQFSNLQYLELAA